MDDEYFQMSPGSISWMEEARNWVLRTPRASAFSPYCDHDHDHAVHVQPAYANMPKRMIEFWRGMRRADGASNNHVSDKMMAERLRRQQQRQGYQALHQLLPAGTKSDKISILETAIMELHKLKEDLDEKEITLMNLEPREKDKAPPEIAEITLRVGNPASGIDSMIQVLNCLKATDSTMHAIRSQFSRREFKAVLEIETDKMQASDIEKAVQKTLHDAEKKYRDKIL